MLIEIEYLRFCSFVQESLHCKFLVRRRTIYVIYRNLYVKSLLKLVIKALKLVIIVII